MTDDQRTPLTSMSRGGILSLYAAERSAIAALASQINDEQWVSLARPDGWTVQDIFGHMADSLGGMTQRLTTMIGGSGILDTQFAGVQRAGDGGFDMDAFNEQRRQKARLLSRQTILHNLENNMAHAEKTAREWPDDKMDVPGPFNMTVRAWLAVTILHAQGHRSEVTNLLNSVPAI